MSAATSLASTVAPHQMRRPGGAAGVRRAPGGRTAPGPPRPPSSGARGTVPRPGDGRGWAGGPAARCPQPPRSATARDRPWFAGVAVPAATGNGSAGSPRSRTSRSVSVARPGNLAPVRPRRHPGGTTAGAPRLARGGDGLRHHGPGGRRVHAGGAGQGSRSPDGRLGGARPGPARCAARIREPDTRGARWWPRVDSSHRQSGWTAPMAPAPGGPRWRWPGAGAGPPDGRPTPGDARTLPAPGWSAIDRAGSTGRDRRC